MRTSPIRLVFVCALVVCGAAGSAYGRAPRRPARVALDVRVVTDEAEAVLSILARRRAGRPVSDADWARLFSTEGYVRLKARETSMRRSFEDEDFKNFVLSDALAAREGALAETLERWRRADATAAARLALAYLPRRARISAKIYPVIKPLDNSFVFDVAGDPAIFLYLDPSVGRAKFENTLAHELHHIGYARSCPTRRTSDEIARLPGGERQMLLWAGAFGEGFAMIAAAGGPAAHPHAASPPEDRARWDKDVANFNDDLKTLEAFFLDLLGNRLSNEETQSKAASFYGVQGPWYTVGWKMSALIETTYGRARLVECICDQRRLLTTYNEAAARHNRRARGSNRLALWSPSVAGVGQRRGVR